MGKQAILKGKLNGQQRNRLAGLLDMLYMPSELADEIGFTIRQVYRVYVPSGCPHERDASGRLWLNGQAFREWYEATYPKQTLQANEAY